MGFASKLSTNFFSRDDGGVTVLASPDTEFGSGVLASVAAPAPAPAVHAHSADDAAERLGHLAGRKQRAAAAAAASAGLDDDLSLPVIGHLSLPRQLRILLVAFACGILVTLLSLWRYSGTGAVAANQTQIASDALMHSQRVGKAAPNAMQGIPDAFAQLQDSRIALGHDLSLLAGGGEFSGYTIPAASGGAVDQLAKVRRKWAVSDAAAASILKMKPELTRFDESLKQLDVVSPEMLALTEEILTERTAHGGSPRELAALGRLMMPRPLSRWAATPPPSA
jgi:twitching motility protein PilJ